MSIQSRLPKMGSINNSRFYLNTMVYSLNRALNGETLNQFDKEKLDDLTAILQGIEGISKSNNNKNLALNLYDTAKNYEYINLKYLIFKSNTFKTWKNEIGDENKKLGTFLQTTKKIISSAKDNKSINNEDSPKITKIFYDIIARY